MSLVSLAKNPVPSGAVDGFIRSHDGLQLRYARWEATRAPLRGSVLIVPGRSEFIEKYFEVVADLRRRGYAVVIYDLRGQGGSDRLLADTTKGHVGRFRDYDRDLDTVMREVVIPSCPQPFIALGHSLGGHILMRLGADANSPFERMVLSAPLVRLADQQMTMPPAVARSLTEMMAMCGRGSAFIPGGSGTSAQFEPFETNILTSDRERFLRATAVLEAAPHLAIGSPTIGWMRACFRSMARLQAPDTPPSVQVPMLFVMAGDDHVVSTTATEEFALRTKLGSRVLIPSSRHEILQETDEIRARFWAAFDAYLTTTAVAA